MDWWQSSIRIQNFAGRLSERRPRRRARVVRRPRPRIRPGAARRRRTVRVSRRPRRRVALRRVPRNRRPRWRRRAVASRYKLWNAVPARRPRHRGVRRLRGVRRRSRHRARRHRHRGQHVGVRRRRRQAPRRWRRRRRQQHRGLGRERARLAQDLLLEHLELDRREAAAVAEGAEPLEPADDVGRLARRLVGLERPELLLRADRPAFASTARRVDFSARHATALCA